MGTFVVDTENLASINRICMIIKARHITHRVIDVLSDYYESSGVEIKTETGLRDLIETEIAACLDELK